MERIIQDGRTYKKIEIEGKEADATATIIDTVDSSVLEKIKNFHKYGIQTLWADIINKEIDKLYTMGEIVGSYGTSYSELETKDTIYNLSKYKKDDISDFQYEIIGQSKDSIRQFNGSITKEKWEEEHIFDGILCSSFPLNIPGSYIQIQIYQGIFRFCDGEFDDLTIRRNYINFTGEINCFNDYRKDKSFYGTIEGYAKKDAITLEPSIPLGYSQSFTPTQYEYYVLPKKRT